MSTIYHEPIAEGEIADDVTFNRRLATLDAAIDDSLSFGLTNNAELTEARRAYANLDARITAIIPVGGGNIATLTNGAAAAGQKIVDVDSTTGFVSGSRVVYMLVGGGLEYNICTVTSSTRLTMTNNIGTGGIGDDSYLSMISLSEYATATVIPHSVDLTMNDTVGYTNRQAYHPEAYGATGDGTTDDTTAWGLMLTAIRTRSAGKVKSALIELQPGADYKITNTLNLCDLEDVVIDGVSPQTRFTYADADATATNRVLFDCLGSARLTFRNFTVYGDATHVPATFFSFGRSTTTGGRDSGGHVVQGVHCRGYWTVAAIYNVASELMHLQDIWVLPTGPAGCKYGIFCSGYNDESIGSEYVTRHADVSMACVWIEHFNVGSESTPTAYIPFKFGREAGNITLRDGYAYTYDNQPIIETTGLTYNLVVENLLCEGTPDNVIHFKAYGGSGTIRNVSLIGVAFGTYNALAIKQDAGTTLYGLFVRGCSGQLADNTSAIELAGDVWHSDIGRWFTSASGGTVVLSNFYNGRLHIANHTLTVTAFLGSELHNDVTGNDSYRHLQTGLRVGVVAATGLAEINNILRASTTWSPGPIADGASAKTYVDLVTSSDGTWYCQASYVPLAAQGWILSAYDAGGVVCVTLINRTGGSVTPTGTLSVVAWKITAAT